MAGVQSRAGLHVGQNHTVVLAPAGTTLSAAVTDSDTYYPAGGR
jgi:hypothetical protein